MWCAYIFAVLSLVSLPSAIQSGNLVTIVGWIAQTFLQLVLLSILAVGQKIQSDQAKKHHAEHIKAIKDFHKKVDNIKKEK